MVKIANSLAELRFGRTFNLTEVVKQLEGYERPGWVHHSSPNSALIINQSSWALYPVLGVLGMAEKNSDLLEHRLEEAKTSAGFNEFEMFFGQDLGRDHGKSTPRARPPRLLPLQEIFTCRGIHTRLPSHSITASCVSFPTSIPCVRSKTRHVQWWSTV